MSNAPRSGDRADGVYFVIALDALVFARRHGLVEEERRLLAHIRKYVPTFERDEEAQPVLPLEFS